MKNAFPYAVLAFCTLTAGCHTAQSSPPPPQEFRLPDIPESLTRPADRADYLTLHYWDSFDFSDTRLIDRPEVTEQAFVDFIGLLPYAPGASRAIDTLLKRASISRLMFRHFTELSDKYLYDPNSPMRNEDSYILILQRLIGCPELDREESLRFGFRLELALKNRPGEQANDFAYRLHDGRYGRLSQIKAPYTLLFFNDPQCQECRQAKETLTASPLVNRLLERKRLALLSVCVEGETPDWKNQSLPRDWTDGCDEGKRLTLERVYDLRAVPALYLLDKEKRVVLKDASLEQIEKRLLEVENTTE